MPLNVGGGGPPPGIVHMLVVEPITTVTQGNPEQVATDPISI
jgi:hypothetical protein